MVISPARPRRYELVNDGISAFSREIEARNSEYLTGKFHGCKPIVNDICTITLDLKLCKSMSLTGKT